MKAVAVLFPLCLGPLVARRPRTCGSIPPSLFLLSRLPPQTKSSNKLTQNCYVLRCRWLRLWGGWKLINLSLKQTTPTVIWAGWDWAWKHIGGRGQGVCFHFKVKTRENSTLTHRTRLTLGGAHIANEAPTPPFFFNQALSNIKLESHGSL